MARYLFLLAKTKDRKFKQKIKGKVYLSLERSRPTQPSRPRGARGSSSPSRASKLLGGMPPSEPRTTRRRRVLPGLPVASSHAWRRRSSVRIHFPLQSFLLLLCSISSPPESAAVHRRKNSWPSTSRSPAKVSIA